MSLDAIVDRIIPILRDGPATHGQLRGLLHDPQVYRHPQLLGNALQKAKAEGLVEYSKAKGDKRHFWRLVERRPARKVGSVVAKAACNGEPVDHIAGLHQQVKSEIDEAHARGFDDGQMHAFQTVADRMNTIASNLPDSPGLPRAMIKQIRDWATEIESGAWAKDEASDE